MTQSEIKDVVSELLWSYRQLYLPGAQSPDTPVEDYARFARESAQAWSVLEAAFGHRKEFRKEHLQDMSSLSLGRLTAQLWGWSRELEWPEGVTNGQWTSTAESAKECAKKTQVFMRDQYSPFTKAIR